MGETIEGTVRDLSRFGEGVVATSRGVVFAAGVLPGERVELGDVRPGPKGVLRAGRFRVLDPSRQRVEPPCPIAGRCGGCPLMIASPKLQLKFKRDLLDEAIRSLPGAPEARVGWVTPVRVLAYRQRARLHWAAGARPRLGYHAPRSSVVTDVRRCAVLDPALDAALGSLRRALAPHLAGRGELHLAMGEGAPVVALRSEEAQPPEVFAALEGLVDDGALSGAALRAGGATVDATFGAPRELREGADGEPLVGPVAGFSQAHDEVNRALVSRVVELARPAEREVLELFAGAGNLSVVLGREARRLVAVEQDEAAAEACRENLRRRGIEATVRTGDAETYRPSRAPDVVVLDPPRRGAPGAIGRIVKLGIPEVVYVSCDPPTLGRDLRQLGEAGYAVTDAVALDMFPQTAHVECVVRLERG